MKQIADYLKIIDHNDTDEKYNNLMKNKFKNMLSLAADSIPCIAYFASFCDFKKTLCNVEKKIEYTTVNKAVASNLGNGKFSGTVKLSKGEYVELDFGSTVRFDTVSLWEKGDNCTIFKIYALTNDGWETVYQQDRILSYHTCYLGNTSAKKLRIEITDCKKAVKLRGLYIFQAAKRNDNFKVSQYLRLDQQSFDELLDNKGFSGYYDVVTDVIIFNEVFLNEKAEIAFNHSEDFFSNQLQNFRKILKDRPIRIWCCIFFDRYDNNGKHNLNLTRDFINRNINKITKGLKEFTEKYGIYGIDYDWEYPKKKSQWNAYNLIVKKTAEVTRVSVAISPYITKFSDDVIKTIEHVNVMAYDMFDKMGNHSNSFLSAYGTIRKVRFGGFKDKQILLGIPTYGRTTDRSADAWPSIREDGQSLGMWNNTIHYEYTDARTNKTKISKAYLNSFAQVRDKTAIAFYSNIGGVMIFRAFCDAPFTEKYSLHRAIDEVIKSKKTE